MKYQTEVEFRGKLKHIKDLSPSSVKKIKITCPDCDKEFDRYARVLFETCSFVCHSCTLSQIHTKTLTVGDKYNKLTVVESTGRGVSTVKCDCGKVVVVGNWNITTGKTKSCGCIVSESLKKFRQENPDAQSGENHPNWKGGVSGERRREMSTNAYKNWRTSVFKRDNYKCQKCGVNNNTLEAHHIQPYASHKLLRTDVDNGVTFCRLCHRKFHSVYGRSNIGRKEFDEFLSEP